MKIKRRKDIPQPPTEKEKQYIKDIENKCLDCGKSLYCFNQCDDCYANMIAVAKAQY